MGVSAHMPILLCNIHLRGYHSLTQTKSQATEAQQFRNRITKSVLTAWNWGWERYAFPFRFASRRRSLFEWSCRARSTRPWHPFVVRNRSRKVRQFLRKFVQADGLGFRGERKTVAASVHEKRAFWCDIGDGVVIALFAECIGESSLQFKTKDLDLQG